MTIIPGTPKEYTAVVVLNAVKDLVFIMSECEGWFNSFSSGNSSIAFHLVNISYRTIHYVKKYY